MCPLAMSLRREHADCSRSLTCDCKQTLLKEDLNRDGEAHRLVEGENLSGRLIVFPRNDIAVDSKLSPFVTC